MDRLPLWALYLQVLGPTVVAVIAAFVALYIGLRQWKTAHYRLTFDLYEKRFAVYEAVKNFINAATVHRIITLKDLSGAEFRAFHDGIRGAEFLFGGEARDFINKTGAMAMSINATIKKLQEQPDHPQADRLIDEKVEELVKFLLDQPVEDIFRPYLDLSKAGLKSWWPW